MTPEELTPDQRRIAAAVDRIWESGDLEVIAQVTLTLLAFQRSDAAMIAGFSALAELGRHDGSPVELMPQDVALCRRVAAVCDYEERVAWARALAFAASRGDARRVAALLDLAARRCAA